MVDVDLSGKVALVTGASRGIGAAVARQLAAAGAHVGLMARTKAALGEVAADIIQSGGKALLLAGDVAEYDQVHAAVTRCMETFGRIDILVNNAGVIEPIAHIADSDPVAWSHVVDINIKGVYHGIHAVLPHMVAQESGVIINISSGAATRVLEGWSHYCATKAAVLSLTKATHLEYAHKGVRVVGLSPGTVATQMQREIKQSGVNTVSQLAWEDHSPPEWPAKAIVYLCGPDAADLSGDDFSIKTPQGRARVGLS